MIVYIQVLSMLGENYERPATLQILKRRFKSYLQNSMLARLTQILRILLLVLKHVHHQKVKGGRVVFKAMAT